MSFDLTALRHAVALRGKVARVVVAGVRGSAPREAGASMLVWQGGQSGTIGGGALELEAARVALAGPSVRTVPLGPSLGQCCGGSVTLACEVYDPQKLQQLDFEGFFCRNISGHAEKPLAILRAERAFGNGQNGSVLCAEGWLIEPATPPVIPIWIYGAGHVGRALVDVLAPLPGLDITWIDTGPERFPPTQVTTLAQDNPADIAPHAPPNAHHLVLTYSHALDLDLCHRLLGCAFASVGLIGSATKWARFRARLHALGHSDAQISRICCPIGQPELGKHPQAIAVGVASRLLSQLRAQTLGKASRSDG